MFPQQTVFRAREFDVTSGFLGFSFGSASKSCKPVDPGLVKANPFLGDRFVATPEAAQALGDKVVQNIKNAVLKAFNDVKDPDFVKAGIPEEGCISLADLGLIGLIRLHKTQQGYGLVVCGAVTTAFCPHISDIQKNLARAVKRNLKLVVPDKSRFKVEVLSQYELLAKELHHRDPQKMKDCLERLNDNGQNRKEVREEQRDELIIEGAKRCTMVELDTLAKKEGRELKSYNNDTTLLGNIYDEQYLRLFTRLTYSFAWIPYHDVADKCQRYVDKAEDLGIRDKNIKNLKQSVALAREFWTELAVGAGEYSKVTSSNPEEAANAKCIAFKNWILPKLAKSNTDFMQEG